MKHQGQFTRPADAGRHGLVLIHPPDEDDRREAESWKKWTTRISELKPARRSQPTKRGPSAATRGESLECSGEEEARLHERRAFVSHESVEVPAKTHASNYFELRYAWPE